MKAHSIEWTQFHRSSAASRNTVGKLNNAFFFVSRAFLALVPALAVAVGATWLVSAPELLLYLQATLWVSGLLFLGLAIDVEDATVAPALLTGVALPVLAVLSSRVAPEFAIVAATVIAIWIAAAIWRR